MASNGSCLPKKTLLERKFLITLANHPNSYSKPACAHPPRRSSATRGRNQGDDVRVAREEASGEESALKTKLDSGWKKGRRWGGGMHVEGTTVKSDT